jgi:hypothetical protein
MNALSDMHVPALAAVPRAQNILFGRDADVRANDQTGAHIDGEARLAGSNADHAACGCPNASWDVRPNPKTRLLPARPHAWSSSGTTEL